MRAAPSWSRARRTWTSESSSWRERRCRRGPNLPPVEFLSGLPLPELAARVAAEPADTIVIYLAQFRDRDGRPYTPREVLRAISETSVAPVYGAAETYIGFGVAAGSVESYEARGRLVGEQVRAALRGGPPDPGRVLLETPSRCVADARALQRWSLDERRLPSGCEIRFADRPFWRQYWWQIAVTLAIDRRTDNAHCLADRPASPAPFGRARRADAARRTRACVAPRGGRAS